LIEKQLDDAVKQFVGDYARADLCGTETIIPKQSKEFMLVSGAIRVTTIQIHKFDKEFEAYMLLLHESIDFIIIHHD
jgi:hypothetical protein